MSKLAALVATKVLGWTVRNDFGPRWSVPLESPFYRKWDDVHTDASLPFDSNIADAMEVVEHVLKGLHVRCILMLGSHMQPNAEFFDVATGQMRYIGSAKTMPEAICLAALRTVMTDAEIVEALR